MSSGNPPDLHMLNVVVAGMAASLDSCQRLGIAVPGDGAGPGVQLKMPGGFSLEPATAEPARLWHAGWRADRGQRLDGPRVHAGQPGGGR